MGKILSVFTTSASVGVTIRYLTAIIGSVLTIIGILGWLSPEQVEALRTQMPELLSTIGALVTTIVTVYAIITKSSSDKAAEVAKQVDAKIPKADTVVIGTPGAGSKIVVPPPNGSGR